MIIPYLLILFRLLLAPVILGLGFYGGSESRFLILILMYLGLISDIFDGIIARKQGLSTEKMRCPHDVPSFYHAYLIRKGLSFKKSKYLNS